MLTSNKNVAVIHNEKLSYPDFPYNPPENFLELDNFDVDIRNDLYRSMRQIFCNLGLDTANFGKPEWNPLGGLIKPGSTVLLKPNWVLHFNPIDNNIDSLITNSSILRVVLDYACRALNFEGRVIIADAPLQSCDFDLLLKINHAGELVELFAKRFKNIEFVLTDLRKTVLKSGNSKAHFRDNQAKQEGDPQGYSLVDISHDSLLMDLIDRFERFRVTCYDHKLLIRHHNPDKNEYLVANSILKADAIINIGKMKCHKKAGLTGALKNLVGINGHKEFLPHHITGSFLEGGDQYIYPSRIKGLYNRLYDRYWSSTNGNGGGGGKFSGKMIAILGKIARVLARDDGLEGSWYGNQTIPRTTIDLNHIAYFYDLKNQRLSERCQRPALHLIDGIVAGEGNGPVTPSAKKAGVLIGGFNPAYVDYTMAKLMGYNPQKLNTVFYSLYHKKSLITNGFRDDLKTVILNGMQVQVSDLPNLKFIKPKYWTLAE